MHSSCKKIPHVIHYFWFGRNPLPPLLKKCLQSWRKYCPDYEIKKWDESNFDINICPYVKEAYKAKKWAFVSDYARFYVLNKYGGIYLDTDVELIKNLTPILEKGPFLAKENENFDSIAPGLGMASLKDNSLFKKILVEYNNSHFKVNENKFDETTVVMRINKLLIRDGLKKNDDFQVIDGFTIYPPEYFCPFNFYTGKLKITSNTVGIHHYAGSWLTERERKNNQRRKILMKILGPKLGMRVYSKYLLMYNFMTKVNDKGWRNAIIYYYKKIHR